MKKDDQSRTLTLGSNTRLLFRRVEIVYEDGSYENVFANKNNKTLKQTLEHYRYANLSDLIIPIFPADLDMLIGTFVLQLKHDDNPLYRRFLNKYGDLTYSNFMISDKRYLDAKGVYAYYVDHELKYIGRCKDSMKKRINQGYGKIHPKNCFRDGQATNCHLNALVTEVGTGVSLWLNPMESDDEIEVVERRLITEYEPPWNIQRA